MTTFKVEIAAYQQKIIIENLMQAYLHELSEFTHDVPDPEGFFPVGKYFNLYWIEPERFPYLFYVNRRVAGFALVRKTANDSFSIAEFFVLHAYRKKGLSKKFAHTIFNLHPGIWSVAHMENNDNAQGFWREVIKQFTNDTFSEEWSQSQPKGPMLVFNTFG